MTDLPKTYTLAEIAGALGMSERWVRQQIAKGAKHMRAGHKIRFTAEQYDDLRKSLTSTGPAPKKSVTTGPKKSA